MFTNEQRKKWCEDVGTFTIIICALEVIFPIIGIEMQLMKIEHLVLGYAIGTLGVELFKRYYNSR